MEESNLCTIYINYKEKRVYFKSFLFLLYANFIYILYKCIYMHIYTV
jgi:hypothetical protein